MENTPHLFWPFAFLLTVGYGVYGMLYIAIIELLKWYEIKTKFRPLIWQMEDGEPIDVQHWGKRP